MNDRNMNSYSAKFLMFFLAMSVSHALHAKEPQPGCEDCTGLKTAAITVASVDEKSKAGKAIEISSKESYQGSFCIKFLIAQDTVDVETIFEDMEASPYASSTNEFWTTAACDAPLKLDTPVPIIFNTASSPVKNEFFPSAVYKYFVKKNDTQTWLKAINTKTSDGLTFLDYLQYNIARGYYSAEKSKEAAIRIVSYICQKGGVYSKYQTTTKCP